jgi:hypothetical protein
LTVVGLCKRPLPSQAIPSICRSRRIAVLNSAKTPSICRNARPAALLVSIGCSVAALGRVCAVAGGEIVVLLHHFVVNNSGLVVNLCEPDATGRSLGFPVPDGHG